MNQFEIGDIVQYKSLTNSTLTNEPITLTGVIVSIDDNNYLGVQWFSYPPSHISKYLQCGSIHDTLKKIS